MPTAEEASVDLGEPRSRTALAFEIIALRHQIAVLKAQRNSSPVFRSLRSAVLELAVLVVAALARKPDDHSAGNRQALVPQRLVWVVEISVRWSLARRTSQGFSRGPRTDHSNGSGELPLGGTANSRRAAHAWVQSLPGDRIPLLGDRAPKSGTIVADVYSHQALAFKYRDNLENSNDEWQSRRDCSYRGNLRRSSGQIARLDTGRRCPSQPRGIAAPPRCCARRPSPTRLSVQHRARALIDCRWESRFRLSADARSASSHCEIPQSRRLA